MTIQFNALLRVLLCAAMAWTAGCQRWNWRGQGYSETADAWAKNLRPPADESQFSGIDAKARDIERSLGVR